MEILLFYSSASLCLCKSGQAWSDRSLHKQRCRTGRAEWESSTLVGKQARQCRWTGRTEASINKAGISDRGISREAALGLVTERDGRCGQFIWLRVTIIDWLCILLLFLSLCCIGTFSWFSSPLLLYLVSCYVTHSSESMVNMSQGTDYNNVPGSKNPRRNGDCSTCHLSVMLGLNDSYDCMT